MNRRNLLLPVFSLLFLVLALPAGATQWEQAPRAASWQHNGYRVERMSLSSDALGPFNYGDAVVVSDPNHDCRWGSCDWADAYVLRGGERRLIPGLPADALTDSSFRRYGGRIVYARRHGSSGQYVDIVARNLPEGSARYLARDYSHASSAWRTTLRNQERSYAAPSLPSGPFPVSDAYGTAIVGVEAGRIYFGRIGSSDRLQIGTGSRPALAGENEAYWRGTDGMVYRAVVTRSFSGGVVPLASGSYRAMRTQDDPAVWLVQGTNRWHVPDEATYFTWFSSWASVEYVSAAELGWRVDRGASGRGDRVSVSGWISPGYPAGTLLKATNGTRVYVVGSDGRLHWVPSPWVLEDMYGAYWGNLLREVAPERFVRYEIGVPYEYPRDPSRI